MGQLFYNIRVIVDDLKHSWYFRIWSVLWAICALFVFIALIVLAQRSDVAGREKDFHYWVQNATEIPFPRFHFRLSRAQSSGVEIIAKNCSHEKLHIPLGECAPWKGKTEPITKCFSVPTDGIVAVNDWNEPRGDVRVDCHITTTADLSTPGPLIAWELDGDLEASAHYGQHHQTTWIAPNDHTWLILEKGVVKYQGENRKTEWGRNLVYHSTVSSSNTYHIQTIIGSFRVLHVEQQDSYNGWMALGGIGGFAYFLLILHTIIMMAVGVIFTNDSKFLTSAGDSSEERTSML